MAYNLVWDKLLNAELLWYILQATAGSKSLCHIPKSSQTVSNIFPVHFVIQNSDSQGFIVILNTFQML